MNTCKLPSTAPFCCNRVHQNPSHTAFDFIHQLHKFVQLGDNAVNAIQISNSQELHVQMYF
jgi:hypothetical protein